MAHFRLLLLCLLASPLLAAPLRVVALHSVLGEVAEKVGGQEIALLCLVPGGVDPHTFNPRPADVREISEAGLVLASGFGMEPYLDRLIQNSGTRAPLFLASDSVRSVLKTPCNGKHDHADHAGHDHGEIDPHWWHSLVCLQEVAKGFAAKLKELRPGAAEGIDRRLTLYLRELDTLQSWVRQQFASLPAAKRHLVTSHDAFGYLARDLGLEVHALHGLNPESEPDAKALSALVEIIRRLGIRAVFVDNTENPKLLASMLHETGARVGGLLYADGLGPRGSGADSVGGMFRHNVSTMLEALR